MTRLAPSKIILEAKETPKGETDLVLGPEVVGLVSHESSGHRGRQTEYSGEKLQRR